ncbi:MAG: hypothetical protein VR70_08895 [Rhodospirillaceae bacterium BRH_c57]|nr:MAG: hypothetical protein VR70_08895 [Rhodospirillaceae bacterium BRH_c57]
MTDRPEKEAPTRRALLRTLTVGAGAAAVLPLAAAPAQAQGYPPAEEVRPRYQLNAWIERYYALNRL